MLILVAILSTLWAFLLPAVNAARDARQLPPVLPQLRPLYEGNPWPFVIGTPIVVTTFVATLLGVVRFFLPKTLRRYFPWRKAAKPSTPPPQTEE